MLTMVPAHGSQCGIELSYSLMSCDVSETAAGAALKKEQINRRAGIECMHN